MSLLDLCTNSALPFPWQAPLLALRRALALLEPVAPASTVCRHQPASGLAFSTKRRLKQKYRSTWLSRSDILHGYRRKCWNLINLMNAQKRQHSQGLKACCLLVSANLTFCLELMSITAKRLCEQ